MRGSRSLGLALVAAALGVAPAMAQQANTGAAPANAPPAANSSAPVTHNAAAMPATTNANQKPAGTAEATDQTHAAAGNTNAAPANTAANATQPAGENGKAAPATSAANTNPPAAGSSNPPATETTNPAPANTAANTKEPAARTAEANKGPSGTLQKYNGDWRSSKLVGATVYNDHGADIGKIDDLLMDDHGKVQTVVVSTGGGVLGIGSKLVSVPFDQIKLEPSVNSTTPATAGAPGGNHSATAANNEAKTEYSVVLPGATEKSLSHQNTFKYASAD